MKPENKIIQSLYAYLSVDEKGNEGIIAFEQNAMPLVAGNFENMIKLKDYVKHFAAKNKMDIILVKFYDREMIEEF